MNNRSPGIIDEGPVGLLDAPHHAEREASRQLASGGQRPRVLAGQISPRFDTLLLPRSRYSTYERRAFQILGLEQRKATLDMNRNLNRNLPVSTL